MIDYYQTENEELIDDFTEIKKELEQLEDVNGMIDNFERNSIFHSTIFLKRTKDQDTNIRIKLLNSELREKEEINERLHSLAYNLGMLRTLLFVKDDRVFSKIKENFLTNDYSSINAVIKELNDFKDKIGELENNYRSLIDNRYVNMDFKVRHEHLLDEHLKSLENMHKKQKTLLKSMGFLFSRAMKNILKQKSLKNN